MSRNKKVALIFLIVVLAVPTSYLALRFWNVVTFHEDSKGLIVQVRIIGLQYVVDFVAIERGNFTCNLTFNNPASETVTLSTLYVNYWEGHQRWQQFLIAAGGGKTPTNIDTGITEVSVLLEFNPEFTGNVLLVQQPVWDISYTPKLGPTAYRMTANIQNSSIQTEGPFYALEFDETESTLTAYMLLIIDVWTVPLEILAVATIFQGRKAEGATWSQDKILSSIYGLQGLGFLATPFLGAIINLLIPPLPPQDFYYSSFAGAFAALLLLALAFSISAVFFLTAYGSLRKRGWAKKLAFILSLLSLLVWSYVEFHLVRAWFFEGLSTMYYLSLIFVFLGLAAANAIAVCVLVWRHMVSLQAR